MPICHGGLGGGALFISTEGAPPTGRLLDMASTYAHRYPDVFGGLNPCDNVYVDVVDSVNDQLAVVASRIPTFLASPLGHGIKLVVIDSIASLFRVEFDVCDSMKRSVAAISHGAALRKISSDFNVAIVVTNQVGAMQVFVY